MHGSASLSTRRCCIAACILLHTLIQQRLTPVFRRVAGGVGGARRLGRRRALRGRDGGGAGQQLRHVPCARGTLRVRAARRARGTCPGARQPLRTAQRAWRGAAARARRLQGVAQPAGDRPTAADPGRLIQRAARRSCVCARAPMHRAASLWAGWTGRGCAAMT